jgi:hypothetical protein
METNVRQLNIKAMNKELIIKALNRAITVYKSNNHQPIWGDAVTGFNADNTKVGTYLTRHPGCIMLPVKLEKGSGYFFIRVDTTIFGNKAYIAWEEDNTMHSLAELLSDMSPDVVKETLRFFDGLITKHI